MSKLPIFVTQPPNLIPLTFNEKSKKTKTSQQHKLNLPSSNPKQDKREI